LPAESVPAHPLYFGAVKAIRVPTELAQGHTGRLWVESRKALSLTANWNGLSITLTAPFTKPEQAFAWLPVPALQEPGVYTLSVTYRAANGLALSQAQSINVQDGGYELQEIELPPDRATLLDPTLITSETQKVATVWNRVSSGPWWSGVFVRPISDQYPTTSPFGTRRTYNGGIFTSYHAGQDFGVPAGMTVTAPADGIVALAEPLQVRGNAVIIDHGHGLLSGYWHLSEIFVQVGQQLKVGDVIGLVGNTGLSTGAHLHWEVHIYGIAVDPMQFVDEPLIDQRP
jgi:murein DD-endopeptidase MepM/ murein hydrolase activator NlpD